MLYRRTILSPKQQETLDFIKQYRLKNGEAPKILEIKEALKLDSLRSVTQRLEALESKGFIRRDRFKHRGITVIESSRDSFNTAGIVRVPVIASAGCDAMEVFAQERYDEYLAIDKSLIGSHKDIVAIKAVGSSMIDAGIHNGDYILMEVTHEARNGDRVVAVIGDMAVIKTFQRVPGAVILNPEAKGAGYSPIVLKEDFQVFGKVISVIPSSFREQDELVWDFGNGRKESR